MFSESLSEASRLRKSRPEGRGFRPKFSVNTCFSIMIFTKSDKAFEAYIDTTKHIDSVSRRLMSAAIELMRRAATHDRSKLVSPEVEMFAEVTHRLKGLTYGSPEYEACRKEMLSQALGHHYYHNRHHPEFFEAQRTEKEEINDGIATISRLTRSPDLDEKTITDCQGLIDRLKRQQWEHISSINEMNLFDLLEMLIDWIAATQRHADGDIAKSLTLNRDRFGMGDQLVQIFENTVPWIADEFAGLKTQRDLEATKNRQGDS